MTVAGQAVVPVDLINIGHWLRLLLGAPTTTGTTNFIHTFARARPRCPAMRWRSATRMCRASTCAPACVPTRWRWTSRRPAQRPRPSGCWVRVRRAREPRQAARRSARLHGFTRRRGPSPAAAWRWAQVTGARLTYANGMEAVRTIRADRRVEGVIPHRPLPPARSPCALREHDAARQAQAGTSAEFALAFTSTPTAA